MGIIVERNGVVTGTGQNGLVRTRINLVEGSGMRVTTADGTDPTELSISSATPDGILMVAEGLKGQNFSRQVVNSGGIATDGTAYFMGVGLAVGDIVTKLLIVVTTAGTAMSLSKVGLYSKAGTLLASSADQGTSWNSSGLKEISLSAAYTVTAQDGYYICIVGKTGTTMPTIARATATGASNAAAATGGMQPFGTQSAQTDLPSPATIGTTSALAYWVGWS